MTKEGKQLLLKDLCARLNCGVEVYAQYEPTGEWYNGRLVGIDLEDEPCFTVQFYKPVPYTNYCNKKEIKPYLRPMSSMTEEEKRELQSFYPGCFGNQWLDIKKGTIELFECGSTITLYLNDSEKIVDWLNKKMFDYHGLIPMGLALEASEGMYEI